MSTLPTGDETALRGFCARILGWSAARTQAIDHALRSIHLSVTHCAALVLLGDTDLVPVAQALHRRTIGAERPFIVCNPRRSSPRASGRSPMSYAHGVATVRAALGGSLCVYRARMPDDLSSMAALVRDPAASVQLIVCADASHDLHPFLLRPVPIRLPPLRARASELPRIVDEYADDAIKSLSADATSFTRADRDWVIAHSASTLPEIEKGTQRLVALRQAGSIHRAAARLGMSHMGLLQWFERRRRKAPR